MGKVLVYWIQITDHGRCDEPRDHIWHTLDIYHYLDIGPGSDENGINAMLNNNPNVLLQVGLLRGVPNGFGPVLQHNFLLLYYFHCIFCLAGWLWPCVTGD